MLLYWKNNTIWSCPSETDADGQIEGIKQLNELFLVNF